MENCRVLLFSFFFHPFEYVLGESVSPECNCSAKRTMHNGNILLYFNLKQVHSPRFLYVPVTRKVIYLALTLTSNKNNSFCRHHRFSRLQMPVP